MNRIRVRQRRSILCQVEVLDDRTLLSTAALTPLPAASPTAGAASEHAENAIRKLEQHYNRKAERISAELVDRTDRLEALYRATVKRDRALVAKASASSGTDARVKLAKADTKFSVAYNQFADQFTSQVGALSTMFQSQVSSLASKSVQIDPQLSVTASALTSDSHAAGDQFVNDMSGELSALAQSFQLGFRALNGVVGKAGNVPTVGGTTFTLATPTRATTTRAATTSAATTSAATTSTGTTIGIVNADTQVFNNDYTQAFSAFNSALSGITSALQTAYSSFASQLTTTATPTNVGIVSSETQVFNNAFTQAMSALTSATNGITTTLQGEYSSFVNGLTTTTTPTTVIGITTPTTVGTTTTTLPIGITTPTLTGGSLTGTLTGSGSSVTVSGGSGGSLI